MYLENFIQKLLFRFKYKKNISKLFNATGYKDISIGKNTVIKDFASLQAHRGDAKGKIKIGNNSNIGESVKILAGSGIVTIGDNVIARSKFTILGGGYVQIGDNVLISHNVVISSSSHDFSNPKILAIDTPSIFNKIQISNNVFIGANSTILMGCSINEGAIIGAGSVVTENTIIGKDEIWYGNPAKFQKSRISLKEKVEEEIISYLKKYPFHNLFILHNLEHIFASEFGGTCSDRTTHFVQKLKDNNISNHIEIKQHIAKINAKATHTILRMLIEDKVYFCDVGMGFPITKLLPSYENIQFTSYGIDFRTQVDDKKIVVFIDEHNEHGEKELMSIDIKEQSQEMVEKNINNRSEYLKELPLSKKLRYFFIYDDKFYKIEE